MQRSLLLALFCTAITSGCATVDLSTPVAVPIEDRVNLPKQPSLVVRSVPSVPSAPAVAPNVEKPLSKQPHSNMDSGVVVEEVSQGNLSVRSMDSLAR